jgi:hypothetical protein
MQEGKGGIVIAVIISLVIGLVFGALVLGKKTINEANETEIQSRINQAVSTAIAPKDAQIADLQSELAQIKNDTTPEESEEEEEIVPLGTYLLEGIYLEQSIEKVLSDREINLFDGKVNFDGKSYNVQETLKLSGLKLKANNVDFEGKSYLTAPKNSIEYTFLFSDNLNISEIDDDERLKFELLGEKVELSHWEGDEITFTQGIISQVNEGESTAVSINGVNIFVKLSYVGENSVYVEVNGDSESIDLGDHDIVGGVDIKVDDLFEGNSKRDGFAVLILGEKVEEKITSGEEFEEDGIWEWVITENSIGLKLSEEFLTIDEDDDYNALDIGNKICLPHNYSCVEFDKLVNINYEDYSFDLDDKNGKDYVIVRGDIRKGIEDYEKVYVNSSGIYNKELELISNYSVELGNTKLLMKLELGNLLIEDFEVNLNLNETNVALKEDGFRTNYGIFVKNPESSVEDQEFRISVPDEKFEAILSIN